MIEGRGNIFYNSCSLYTGVTEIHDDNIIYDCSLGLPPEIRDFDGENLGVIIGSNNIIREYVTIHGGANAPTVVGDHCFLMTKSHLGHDVHMGDYVTVSPGACIGGHCIVEDHVTIGMNAVIHQGLRIGEGAMIGMGSVVTKDVKPFEMVYGNPARPHGENTKKWKEIYGDTISSDDRDRN